MKLESMTMMVLIVGMFLFGGLLYINDVTSYYGHPVYSNFTNSSKLQSSLTEVNKDVNASYQAITNTSVFSSIPVIGGFMDTGLGLISGGFNALKALFNIGTGVLPGMISDMTGAVSAVIPIPSFYTAVMATILLAMMVFAVIAWFRGKSW